MEMDEEFLEINDLDWFAISEAGRLCHFATGGKGIVAPEVKSSIPAWELALEYVNSLPRVFEVSIIEENIPTFESPAQRARFLVSYVEMASRGLFSHDFFDGGYLLIAKPEDSVGVVELTEGARKVIPVLALKSDRGGLVVRMG